MLGSKSPFFLQSPEVLSKAKGDLYTLLRLKGYYLDQVAIYTKAYDYFCQNPDGFDGATIVKDLCDIPGLDLDAMLHDYHYINYNVAASFTTKWKADWLYAKGNERKGKGQYSAFSRFVGLTIVGIGFVPYARWKRGKNINKADFLKEYEILIK